MKTHSRTAVAVCTFIGLLGLLFSLMRPVSSAAQAAFIVEYTEVMQNHASGHRLQRDSFWAFRSDGAIAFGSRGMPSGNRKILNPNDGTETDVSDAVGLKTTYRVPPERRTRRQRRVPPRDCAAPPNGHYRFVGNEVVLRYTTYVYEHNPPPDPDGGTTTTRYWLAPDLLCFEMKTHSEHRNGLGNLTNTLEKTVTAVRAGEPEPALFEVPSSFSEVRPSEYSRALAKFTTGEDFRRPGSWQAELDRRDAKYDASR